jgi:ribulose-phosphate 3-epimerase
MAWREWVRKVEIEPSLYAADFSRLGEQITHLLHAGARIFHFDVGDGHFVEPVTMGPIVLRSIAPVIHAGGGVVDCHLMVEEPMKHFQQIREAGGDSVTFHVEACDEPWKAIELARGLGLAVGVAFKPETSVEDALAASLGADLVLCMSIHPGYSGQEFLPDTHWRLSRLRRQLHENIFVQVDGGIGPDNVREVHKVGADLLVAGSAIFDREDLPRAYTRLVRELA